MQPFNYNIQAPDYSGMISSALQMKGQVAQNNVYEAQAQKIDLERQALVKKQQDDAVKQQELIELSKNPSSKAVQEFILRRPEVAEQFKASFDSMSDNERRASTEVQFALKSALESNRPDLATSDLDRRMEAAKNSGDAVALEKLSMLKNLVVANPDAALLQSNAFLASTMDPEKFASMEKTRGEESRSKEMQPSVLKESEAKAEKAAVVAKFAESDAAMELQKKGWDIKKIQNDMQVSRQNVAIAAQNAAVSRANSETSRMEAQIKLQDLIQKRDGVVREKTAEVDSARASIDNMLNTADRILKTPMGVVGSAAGPLSARLPTLSQSTADFESLIENLDAQSFIAQIPNMKGTGALSDAEGKKLAAALQSFSLRQSPEQLLSNVKEAQRIMLDSRKRLASKYGVPDTVPNTPAAAPGGNDIDALLKKYGQ